MMTHPLAGFQADARGGLQGELPLIGRDREVQRLNRLLDLGDASTGPALLIRGEAGVGKTRLLRAASATASERDMQVFLGRAFSLDSGLSYAVLADAFLPLLQGTEPSTLQKLTRGRLAELYGLFPTAASGGEIPDLSHLGSPEETRATLFYAFAELLRGLAKRSPILVVAEDLQWADPSAIQLLHFAVRHTEGESVRFLCSSTEGLRERNPALLDFETSLIAAGLATSLDLEPLGEAEIRKLVATAFSMAEEPVRSFSAQLHAWSRGNPLFATEILKAMVENGQLRLSDGVWTGWDVSEIEPPKGVQDLVVSRLARLGKSAQRIAEVSATMGDRIRFGILTAVSGLSDEETLEAVDELRMRGILEEGEGGAESLTFTHPLIRECVYNRLGGSRARLLHRQVADALESSDPGSMTERAEELAYHFHRSGDDAPGGKALQYLLVAGRRAMDRRADEEAARHLTAALELMDREESAGDGDGALERVGVIADLARSLNRMGRYQEAIALWKQALRETPETSEDPHPGELRRWVGLACFWSGRYTEALAHFEAGLAAAADHPLLRGRIKLVRGLCLQELARWDEAAEDINEALSLAEAHDDEKTRIGADQLLTLQYTWTGRPASAREHGWRAIREAETADDKSGAFESHLALAMMEGLTGNLPEMRNRIADARRLAEELRSPILELRTDELSLQEAHATGAWDAAVALGQDAVARARALGQHSLLVRLLVWTALPVIGRGDLEYGRELVEEAWKRAGLASGKTGPSIDVHAAVPAFIGRAALHLAEGDIGKATTVAEEGLEMADRSGAAIWSIHHLIPLLAQSYLWAQDLEGAQRLGRRLRRDAMRMDHVLGLAWADTCDALVASAAGDLEGGSTRLRAAADRLDGIPMVFDAARVRRQLAGRLAELGRMEEALSELRRAHAILRDLGAEPELEETRRMFREMETRPPPRSLTRGLGGLTGRELEISRLVAARRSNKAIAKELGISPRTVTTHLTNIYGKLEIGSRGELVDLVRDRGWTSENAH